MIRDCLKNSYKNTSFFLQIISRLRIFIKNLLKLILILNRMAIPGGKVEIPKKYNAKEREQHWKEFWGQNETYKYKEPQDKSKIFSIDTPPPTVSGKMHVGHSFSYTQMDFIARYKRITGHSLFYPFGTDDNGLATERLVEKMKKVKGTKMPRHEFVELCRQTVDELRDDFVDDWKHIGVSADYSMFYSSVNANVQRLSQKYFLDLVKNDKVYRKESPILFCPNCQTAIAQVELEDFERQSIMNTITFDIFGGGSFEIGTTRPELLGSCVAVFYNPEHPRAKELEGKRAIVPIFENEVPMLPDSDVLLEKGTGIVMCCTFGDQKDMEWYKQYNLPLRISIGKDGRMNKNAGKYSGMPSKEARSAILDDLKAQGKLLVQKEIKQIVNVHERCGTEIEILHEKQWFIRVLDMKDELLEAGRNLKWHPEFMRNRYDNWTRGLQWDWNISRQRFFGVPFPVWYDENDNAVFADESQLPVDPLNAKPAGYKGDTNTLTAENDVMDTWATSSLTPEIAIELFANGNFEDYYPLSLRPQAHDIISFWLFNSTVRGLLHKGSAPWKNASISGWVLDPKGRKMSKSKGNVIDPRAMIEKYSADGLRYAASVVKLGEDSAFKEQELQNGMKTATKIFNASKFAIMHLNGNETNINDEATHFVDRWLLTKLTKALFDYKLSFEEYDYSSARRSADTFFWQNFTDNYMEFAKHRLYDDNDNSAVSTLHKAILSAIKMYCPFIPFVTEEVYHYYDWEGRINESVHTSLLPDFGFQFEKDEKKGDLLAEIIALVRKEKSSQQKSMKAEVKKLSLSITSEQKELADESLLNEIKQIMFVSKITISESDSLQVGCEF